MFEIKHTRGLNMKTLSKLISISAQYTNKKIHYAHARLGGKIIRLVILLLFVAASIVCTYGAKYFLTSKDSLGALIVGVVLAILAVGMLLSMLSNLIQYAILGFSTFKASPSKNTEDDVPVSKKSDLGFGIVNMLYILILIAGDIAVLLI